MLRSAFGDLCVDNNQPVVTLGPGRKAMLFEAARVVGRTGFGLTRTDLVRLAVGAAALPAVPGYVHSLVLWHARDSDNACVLESTADTAIHLR